VKLLAEKTKDAAGFVLFNEHEEVLLVRQKYGKKKWAIPGGAEEDGESSWQTAIRECKEEIDIDIDKSQCSLSGLYFLSHRNAYVYIFKAIYWCGEPKPDGVEIGEIAYFSIDKLPVPMSNFTVQRIKDAAMNNPMVVLREQHVNDYIIGDPKDFEIEKY
jgi:8-oxo-dGTP pyrophosphatase MutT (NUDIX family)